MKTLKCSCITLTVIAGAALVGVSASVAANALDREDVLSASTQLASLETVTLNAASSAQFGKSLDATQTSQLERYQPPSAPIYSRDVSPDFVQAASLLRATDVTNPVSTEEMSFTFDPSTDFAPPTGEDSSVFQSRRAGAERVGCDCPFGACIVVPGAVASLVEAEPFPTDPTHDANKNDYCVYSSDGVNFVNQPFANLETLAITGTGTYTICGTISGVSATQLNVFGDLDHFLLTTNATYTLSFTTTIDEFFGRFAFWWGASVSGCLPAEVGQNPVNDCNALYCLQTTGLPAIEYGLFGLGPGSLASCVEDQLLDANGNPGASTVPAGSYGILVGAFGNSPATDIYYTVTIDVQTPPVGACTVAGVCTDDSTLVDCLANDGVYRGDGSLCADEVTCTVALNTPGAQTAYGENESTCDVNQNPDTNGGCLANQASFTEIFVDSAFGSEICLDAGTSITGTFGTGDDFAPGNSSGFVIDIDAFQFDLLTPQQVTVTITSEGPFNAALNQGFIGVPGVSDTIDCDTAITFATATGTACEAGVTMSACLPAGRHFIDIFPGLVDGAFQGVACGTPYRMEISCSPCLTGACELPDGTCTDMVDAPTCINVSNGVYLGDNATCMADGNFCDVCDGTESDVMDDLCADFTDDVTNGGCFATTPNYIDISGLFVGPTFTFCGTTGVFSVDDGLGGTQAEIDQDWYSFTVPAEQQFTFAIEANADVFMAVVPNIGSTSLCATLPPQYDLLSTDADGNPDSYVLGVNYERCDAAAEITICLPAGNHALLVASNGDRPCGFEYKVTGTLAACPTGACCLPGGMCTETSEANCERPTDAASQPGLGGIFLGVGTLCSDGLCCQVDCTGAISEGETATCDVTTDMTNAGCEELATTEAFTVFTYSEGVLVCGETGTDFDPADPSEDLFDGGDPNRDVDWYYTEFTGSGSLLVEWDTEVDIRTSYLLTDGNGVALDCSTVFEDGAFVAPEFLGNFDVPRCPGTAQAVFGTANFPLSAGRLYIRVRTLGVADCSGGQFPYSFRLSTVPAEFGPCCIPDGDNPPARVCVDDVNSFVCTEFNDGIFFADADCCEEVTCPDVVLTGSCVFSCSMGAQVPCFEDTEANCDAAGGIYLGDGTTCANEDESLICQGDISGDNITDLADFNVLGINFGAGPNATRSQGDLTCDGNVGLADFNVLGIDFGCDKTALFTP